MSGLALSWPGLPAAVPALPARDNDFGVPGTEVKGQLTAESGVCALTTESALLFTLKFGRMLKYL